VPWATTACRAVRRSPSHDPSHPSSVLALRSRSAVQTKR
jgi:hypothetical protein